MKLLAQVDGGCSAEGQAYIGVVLVDRETGEMVYEKGHAIGRGTNNVAEYSAVVFALYQAREFGCDDIIVQSDSKLIVNQVNGDWRIHENHLKDYVLEVRAMSSEFKIFVIEWIPRGENKLADKQTRVVR